MLKFVMEIDTHTHSSAWRETFEHKYFKKC